MPGHVLGAAATAYEPRTRFASAPAAAGTEEGQRSQPRCRSGSPTTEPSGTGAKLDPPGHTQPIPAPSWTQGANSGQYFVQLAWLTTQPLKWAPSARKWGDRWPILLTSLAQCVWKAVCAAGRYYSPAWLSVFGRRCTPLAGRRGGFGGGAAPAPTRGAWGASSIRVPKKNARCPGLPGRPRKPKA
jgi:hypothetical protein